LKFHLPKELADSLRAAGSGRAPRPLLELLVDHPAYTATATLPATTLLALAEDLES
jgi:hypothetical protein